MPLGGTCGGKSGVLLLASAFVSANQPTPGPDSGWEFYSDPAAVSGYIAHRAAGLSRNSLIEEPAFLSLLADVKGRDCLDLGCGYGHYSELMANRGARVTGLDRAPLMIAKAQASAGSRIKYFVADIETVELQSESFDAVISNLSFHYIDDIAAIFQKVFGWLRPGGQFVFSVEHPIFTAAVEQNEWADDGGRHSRWIVSDYFHEGQRWGFFGRKYHHTLETWSRAVLLAGFTLTSILEPSPSLTALEAMPSLVEDKHRPLFLLISCRRGGDSGENEDLRHPQ
jgi:SAM-dependent methyltransferase